MPCTLIMSATCRMSRSALRCSWCRRPGAKEGTSRGQGARAVSALFDTGVLSMPYTLTMSATWRISLSAPTRIAPEHSIPPQQAIPNPT